ncbi:MAG: polysaccharide deacetylase family protein [Desulfovermiculus sp.]
MIVALDTDKRVAALTLDACHGEYDSELIEYLRQEGIPATLFITCLWIEENQGVFEELAQDPLFSIANHGTRHLPLSVSGEETYGIKGTEGPEEIVQEVLPCSRRIEEVVGQQPRYFRSGTAHYDELAVRMVNDLGLEVIGFTVAADKGATLSREEIAKRMQEVEPGGIILAHMNRPGSEVAEGLKEGISGLERQGYRFVHLEEHEHNFLRQGKD